MEEPAEEVGTGPMSPEWIGRRLLLVALTAVLAAAATAAAVTTEPIKCCEW